MGLADVDRTRHIAWDIGVAGLGALLAPLLDATFISQTYSRLVVDCNRAPTAADAMPSASDATAIPANMGLNDFDRAARIAAIHEPYQRAIAAVISRRAAAGRQTILVSLHSFTPALRDGTPRPWEVGVLHDGGDPRFAVGLVDRLRADDALTVGDNEPYRMDLIDYTVPLHAYERRLPYAELEVRQDLIATGDGQRRWANLLGSALLQTVRQYRSF